MTWTCHQPLFYPSAGVERRPSAHLGSPTVGVRASGKKAVSPAPRGFLAEEWGLSVRPGMSVVVMSRAGSGTAAPAADTASSCGHFVLATVDSAIHTGEAQLNASG